MKLLDTKNQLTEKQKHMDRVAAVDNAVVLNIQLRKGEEIAEHDADSEVFIIVRKGRVRFTVEGETVELTPDNVLHMDPREKHSLHAIEESDLIVIQAKP
ncbi:cupin domain-containing protein [Sporosarcina sp. PTS2304]|uniref:cupin domain-containing protein n=1 Tax=Sporosarcina sp. PTS2304 TaxID=2283194 RepID=UPI000E0D494D|nr:cupin domain-containing protein [Sporosarcina sp. PTS2304]AXH99632.1 cupin domain-containing protein [Sporosarcina sp. PTS2304]